MHALSSFSQTSTTTNPLFNLISNTSSQSKLSQNKFSLSNDSETNSSSISSSSSSSSCDAQKTNRKNDNSVTVALPSKKNNTDQEVDDEEYEESDYLREKETFENGHNEESVSDQDETNSKENNSNHNNDDLDLDLESIQNELKNSKTFVEELNAYVASTNANNSNSNSSFSPVHLAAQSNPYSDSFFNGNLFSRNLPYGDFGNVVKTEKVFQIYEDDLIDRREKLVDFYKNEFYMPNNCYCDTKQNLFIYGGNKQNTYKLSKSLQRKLVNLNETFLSTNNTNTVLASELLYKKGKSYVLNATMQIILVVYSLVKRFPFVFYDINQILNVIPVFG
jgi:hypothetical protein